MRQTTVLSARVGRRVGGLRRSMSNRAPKHSRPHAGAGPSSTADKLPKIFRDPTNQYGYPYNVHETDGLSRNPDDCARWGCVDVGGGGF